MFSATVYSTMYNIERMLQSKSKMLLFSTTVHSTMFNIERML
jgi:hypothetical protein